MPMWSGWDRLVRISRRNRLWALGFRFSGLSFGKGSSLIEPFLFSVRRKSLLPPNFPSLRKVRGRLGHPL